MAKMLDWRRGMPRWVDKLVWWLRWVTWRQYCTSMEEIPYEYGQVTGYYHLWAGLERVRGQYCTSLEARPYDHGGNTVRACRQYRTSMDRSQVSTTCDRDYYMVLLLYDIVFVQYCSSYDLVVIIIYQEQVQSEVWTQRTGPQVPIYLHSSYIAKRIYDQAKT